MAKRVGICFSRDLTGTDPLSHIIAKKPVYLRLLDLLVEEGFAVFVLTRKTYLGNGVFDGVWEYQNKQFSLLRKKTKIDLVYDRSGGVVFPPGEDSLRVVNIHDFKILCWDKLKTFQEIGPYMAKTIWVGDFKDYQKVLPEIKTDWVVLKPYNGLKGMGIYVGPKDEVAGFKPMEGKHYVAQEFVDTTKGISGITESLHDLRVVIINQKPVWCHVRVPPTGSFKANVAEGGSITEVNYNTVPESIKSVVKEISERFYEKYDNPIFSLDFGLDKSGKPYIFEINDQVGFPKWEMKNRDTFLKELVANFKGKLQ
jgi:glutathione synthase/RimK-type ligase-like ATP-grasp enzyme